jgi:hypothetical protein
MMLVERSPLQKGDGAKSKKGTEGFNFIRKNGVDNK